MVRGGELMPIKNEDISINVMAKHFEKTHEAMRQLKRKWEAEKSGLWIIYVKAYNYDMLVQEIGEAS